MHPVAMDTRRTGLMVIRAWVEKGSAKPLRAEIRRTSDLEAGFESTASLTEKETVLSEVKVFLDSVTAEPPLAPA